jgi:hypothetical protein
MPFMSSNEQPPETVYRAAQTMLSRFRISDQAIGALWFSSTYQEAFHLAAYRKRDRVLDSTYVYTCRVRFGKIAEFQNEDAIYALARQISPFEHSAVRKLAALADEARNEGFDGIMDRHDWTQAKTPPWYAALRDDLIDIIKVDVI